MTRQKAPHTQTQQNVKPEQTDLEPDQQEYESGTERDEQIYHRMEGAETGENRTPRKVQTRSARHITEPSTQASEGSVTTRTPKRPAQGITSHRAEEESARQEKVVRDRPDVQAGVNQSNKSRKKAS